MKKSILAIAVLLGSTSFAQEMKSDMGEDYLPAAGDWAIGIDATPFLNYVGNLIGGQDGNTAPSWNALTTNQTITGKMFKEDNLAYRGSLRIGFGSANTSNMVLEETTETFTYPEAPHMVEDTWKQSAFNVGISAGLEKRRGFGRLQGYYGAEVGIGIATSSESYEYGNAIIAANGMPATSDWGLGNITQDTYGNVARVTESKSGMAFQIGARAFIGAEYFVMPRIAIGGEFGWGLGFAALGTSSVTIESTDGTTVGTQTTETNNGSGFALDTDSNTGMFGPAGSLRMTFHF
ncbi:MAG: hypothetical protein CL844_02855 [Crocinitomicaceae bacterium]|nr:hypothetical protein [Crocinitomicaceae bacterium]